MPNFEASTGRMHLLMAGVAAAFLVLVGPFLVPVMLGAVLAAVMAPLRSRLQQHARMSAMVAAASTTLLFAGGLLLPFVLLLVAGVRSLTVYVDAFLARTRAGGAGLEDTVLHAPWLVRIFDVLEQYTSFQRDTVGTHLTDLTQQVGVKVGGWLGSGLQQLPQGLLFIFLMLLALHFFMVDGQRLESWIMRQSPFLPQDTVSILDRVKTTCAKTLLSSVAVSAAQSGILFVGMLVVGVPSVLVWFTVAFLMAFLPIIGTVPLSLGWTLYFLANGEPGYATVMLVCLVLAGLSDNVVRPLVIGGEGGQHPLILLLSIFGGLSLLGFAGLFLGPVVASLFLAVLEVYTNTLRPRTLPPQGVHSLPPTP